MFKNNNNYYEEVNFFHENNRDIKMQRGLSNERIMNPFVENLFEAPYDFSTSKWNSFPNNSFYNEILGVFPMLIRNNSNSSEVKFNVNIDKLNSQQENKEIDDNRSNLADTEEHASIQEDLQKIEESPKGKVEEVTKEYDTNEHSFDSNKLHPKDVGELLDLISEPKTDMNAFLTDILTAGPTDPSVKRKRTVTQETKGKRMRKSKDQIESLQKEYEMNSNWDNDEIEAISVKLELKKKQVYKWYWDHKAKNGELKPKSW
jgi:hypothetical protein